MAATGRPGSATTEHARVTTVTISGSLQANRADAAGPGTMVNASARAPTRQIYPAALVVAVAADVDPLQSIWRPQPAPAVVVAGVGIGRAKERKTIEAVMVTKTVP